MIDIMIYVFRYKVYIVILTTLIFFAGLYYLDSLYEKVERVDLPDGGNPQVLLDNEINLKTIKVFQKRPGEIRDISKCSTPLVFMCTTQIKHCHFKASFFSIGSIVNYQTAAFKMSKNLHWI